MDSNRLLKLAHQHITKDVEIYKDNSKDGYADGTGLRLIH